MNQIEALRRLRQLQAPAFETRDAAALLEVTPGNANTILRRLASRHLITHLNRGRWLMDGRVDPLALPELLSAPWPAYVSLQSALFHHGLIEQVPAIVYAVTLARPRRVTTPLATISFHRVPPELFTGFELAAKSDVKIATAEKALFDLLYLAPGRSRVFARLPELDISARFRWARVKEYVALVKSPTRRSFLTARIEALRRGR